jgi:hypothetical protein
MGKETMEVTNGRFSAKTFGTLFAFLELFGVGCGGGGVCTEALRACLEFFGILKQR